MSRRRPGWRAAERLYNHLSRDLWNKAKAEAVKNAVAPYKVALQLCLTELEQVHRHYYPKCDGGCPCHEALMMARTLLSPSSPSPSAPPKRPSPA